MDTIWIIIGIVIVLIIVYVCYRSYHKRRQRHHYHGGYGMNDDAQFNNIMDEVNMELDRMGNTTDTVGMNSEAIEADLDNAIDDWYANRDAQLESMVDDFLDTVK